MTNNVNRRTWTQPRDIADDAIITARYWNQILGTYGSLAYIDSLSNQRANCTVHSATFTKVIPSGSSEMVRINSFRQYPSNPSFPNKLVFSKNSGAIIIPPNRPVILLWHVDFDNSSNGYWVRSNLERTRVRNNTREVVRSVVASHYMYKNTNNISILSCSFASISDFVSDKYYISVNHGSPSSRTVNGTITMILNPCFV